jgi:hypothetical protein
MVRTVLGILLLLGWAKHILIKLIGSSISENQKRHIFQPIPFHTYAIYLPAAAPTGPNIAPAAVPPIPIAVLTAPGAPCIRTGLAKLAALLAKPFLLPLGGGTSVSVCGPFVVADCVCWPFVGADCVCWPFVGAACVFWKFDFWEFFCRRLLASSSLSLLLFGYFGNFFALKLFSFASSSLSLLFLGYFRNFFCRILFLR